MKATCGKTGCWSRTTAKFEDDVELWRARAGWSTPTLQITPDRADNFKAFPDGYRDGLPASHGQHTCILLLNITERCNYGCGTCYAAAKAPGTPSPKYEHPTREEIVHTVQTMLAREGGKLGVLMLSGGEPTIRDDLPELLEALFEHNIVRVLLNTNGRRLARDEKFLQFLANNKNRVEVYLQFDGFEPGTYEALRNENVAQEKLTALQKLNDAGVWTTLVTTVARGINEHELGAIVQFAMNTPRIAGVMLQPVFGSGRAIDFDPQNRATPTGVLRRLHEQTNGALGPDDFIPLPCSHRDCCDITYLLKTAAGQWKSLPQLIRREELKNWIHLVSNTIAFDDASGALKTMLKSGAIARVFSEQNKTSGPQLMLDMARLCGCVPGVQEVLGAWWTLTGQDEKQENSRLEKMAERTLRITTKMFMDAHTFHAARIRQCCVHTGTFEDDPRRYSFCWRWLFADASDFPQNDSLIQIEPKINSNGHK
jgi:uncharacterized radical SAM superfamily Fe-S cluster-containing enzyme